MKTTGKTLVVLIFLALATVPATSLQVNVTQDRANYSLNNPGNPVVINASINSSDPGSIYFQTNETGSFENRSEYIEQITNLANSTYVEITWNNQNNVLTRKPVKYRVQANNSFSENKSFDILFQPEISNISISVEDKEDFNPGDIIQVEAKVKHPIGRGRIENVEAEWVNPENERTVYEMRRQEETENGFPGYRYESSYGNTVELGTYKLIIRAEDNNRTVRKTRSFKIEQTDEGVRISPLFIGQASIFEVGGNIGGILSNPLSEQNFASAAFIFMIVLSVGATLVIQLGNRGVEVTDFTR